MPVPVVHSKQNERMVSDEEMAQIRQEFKNLTPVGKAQAKELEQKIKALDGTRMEKSCNRLKLKLAHLVGSTAMRKESAGGGPKDDADAPDVVAMAKKQ